MTTPTATPEPAVISGAVNSIVNAVLGVLLVCSVVLPMGLGGALNTLVSSVAAGGFILWPLVSGFIVRSKVTPVPKLLSYRQIAPDTLPYSPVSRDVSRDVSREKVNP